MSGVTLLGYAILGLLNGKASSGYDLRKIFAETPMGTFSDSPGAIYPALRRLEERKLIAIRPHAEPVQRRRRVLQLTQEGFAALKNWLETPLRQADVASRMPMLMLKFAFMEGALGETAMLIFLRSFERELNAYIPLLAKFTKSELGHMPKSGHLALQSGLRGYRVQAQWVAHAIAVYEVKVDL
jgi:DNA-binding PadR family transcriptional regulator